MPNPYLPLDQKITGDIYTSPAVMENLTILCDDFGSRFGGTEGERQAAAFFAARFAEYGLTNIRQEPVEYLGWVRGDATLEILSPIRKTIDCISLPYSPAAELEASLVDLGDGDPPDFDARAEEIKGQILLTTSAINPQTTQRWVHRKEKFGRSLLAGAAGFIFVNHYPGLGPATGGIGYRGQAAPIPGISISKEDGAFLQRLVQRHGTVRLRLVTRDHTAPMTSWNICADIVGDTDLAGSALADQVVMLGCHYDGHDISQGAVDPASGAAALLEAARVLAQHARALPCTLRFALWGIEEIGLLGSRAYVKQHAAELGQIRFYLNMDAAGGAAPKDINLHAWPELQATFERYQAQMALDFAIGQTFHSASDHFPFLQAGVVTGGIETVRQVSTGRGYGHTRHDTLDKVKLSDLRAAADLAARLALRIASEPDWPVSRRDPAAVAALLNSPERQALQEFQARMEAYLDGLG